MKVINSNIEKLLTFTLLSGCLLLSGCSKDDDDTNIPGQPNEKNEIVLTRNVSASIPLFSATSATPPGDWLFCLADEDDNEYLIPGSAGEKKTVPTFTWIFQKATNASPIPSSTSPIRNRRKAMIWGSLSHWMPAEPSLVKMYGTKIWNCSVKEPKSGPIRSVR